jgi:single-strand selective monofunctional uracil DNA glycosylase
LRNAQRLRTAVNRLKFALPVTHVYNPLDYAWGPFEQYLRRFAVSPKKVVFLGMNPGPFGMVQTGIPFGEVAAVRDWLGLRAEIVAPKLQHARRPITGFDCPRSEVSGRRLWGLFAGRFSSANAFFENHLVINYCPLAFLEESGKNRTPDKLPAAERDALYRACDEHLLSLVSVLQPQWLVAVGDFAFQRSQLAVSVIPGLKAGRILHPSPASPLANRGWAELAARQLTEQGIWRDESAGAEPA